MPLLSVISIALLGAGQVAPRFERLDNGLRVVVVEDHALPLVSVQLWYHVGSACDPPDRPGLSAVSRAILEHRDDAASKLREPGGRFESRTGHDACRFSSVLPPESLEHALDAEAARMQPLHVTREISRRGFEAAARAYAEVADNPNHVVTRQLPAAMFPDHPYQHPPGFVAESLKGLAPREVDEFLRRWFVPANATLFVIGDASSVRVLDLVRRKFGGLESTEPTRRPEPRRPDAETLHISISDARHAGVTFAWRTSPLGYFDNAAIDVLMHRLCNPVDGPLCRRLTEIGCGPPRWRRHAWRDAGMLALSVDAGTRTGPDDLTKIEMLIAEELAHAARETSTEIEHNRARTLARREVLNRTATFADRANALAAYQVVAGDALLADFAVPRIAAVAAPDVCRAAAELTIARTVLARTSAASGAVSRRHSRPPASQPSGEPRLPTDASRSSASLTTHDLGNGVRVAVRQRRGSGELADVSTLLTMPRPPESLQTLLDTGSTRHSAKQIRDYLSYHGLDLAALRQDSRRGLRSRGPTSHLAQMIELQAELLRYPANGQPAELGEIRTVEILVAGDVDPAAAVAAARLAWGDWQASASED